MTELSENEGVLLALIERLEKTRLPRALEIKERVDQGSVLSVSEMDFLKRIISDAQEYQHYIDERPDLQALFTRGVSLYF
jgi:hypothetical protein